MLELHYSGPAGQKQLKISAIVEAIVADPDAVHHLWKDGWPGWRSWEEVPEVAKATRDALAVRDEDPHAVAEYTDLIAEMAADGVLEEWERQVLEDRRQALGISQQTHDRLIEQQGSLGAALLSVQIDEAAMADFRSGESCVIRLRVKNESSRGIAVVHAQVATSSTDGVVQVDVNRLAPGADEPVLVRLSPEVAGQHEFHALFTAVGYDQKATWYRSRALVFQVARAQDGAGTKVYNVDLSSMQVGKVGNLGSDEQRSGGLLQDARWVRLPVTPLSEAEAEAWLDRQNASLPGAPAMRGPSSRQSMGPPEPPPASAPEEAPKAPAPVVREPVVYHYSGPSGQAEHPDTHIAELVAQAPDADHHVWREGFDGWKPWSEVPELASVVRKAGRPSVRRWHHMRPELCEKLCEKVASDRLFVSEEDREWTTVVGPIEPLGVLVTGVDAHAIVRAGLCETWTMWDGHPVACTDTTALLVGGQMDVLEEWIKSPPIAGLNVPWFVFLRAMISGDADEARAALDDHLSSRPCVGQSVAGLWVSGRQEEARAMAESTAAQERNAWQCVRALSRLFDATTSVHRLATQMEYGGALDDSNEVVGSDQVTARQIRVQSHLLDDAAGAERLLASADDLDAEDSILLAFEAMSCLGKDRKALRLLTKAGMELAGDDDPSMDDAIKLAWAWGCMFDDLGEARKALQLVDGQQGDHEGEMLRVAAWQHMLTDRTAAQRAMAKWESASKDSDALVAIAACWLHLFDDRQAATRAIDKAGSALGWFLLGDERAGLRALVRASTSPESGQLLGLVRLWRWMAGDLDEARSLLSQTPKKSTAGHFRIAARAAWAIPDPDLATRLITKAEASCDSVHSFAYQVQTLARYPFSDLSEARRVVRVAISWGRDHAEDDSDFFSDLIDYIDGLGLGSEVLDQVRDAEKERQAELERQNAEKKRKAAADRKRKAEADRKRKEEARRKAEADRKRKEEARRKSEADRKRNAANKAAAAAAAKKKASGSAQQSFKKLKSDNTYTGAGISKDAGQAWWVSKAFPKAFISWAWANGMDIISLFHFNGEYTCATSLNADYLHQGWKTGSKSVVQEYINTKIKAGYVITDLDIEGSTWMVVMTKVKGSSKPKFIVSPTYPRDWIKARFDASENILGCSASDANWVVWSAKQSRNIPQATFLRNDWTTSRDTIREKWKEDFLVHDITHKNGSNFFFMSKGLFKGGQRYSPCRTMAKLTENWDKALSENRKIQFIGHDDDSWWLVTAANLPWYKKS